MTVKRMMILLLQYLQEIFNDWNKLKVLKSDLAYIHANFSFLSLSITELGKTTNLLSETIKGIISIQEKLIKINSSKSDAVKWEIHLCFCKNKGFKVMWNISCIIEGEDLVDAEDLKNIRVNDIVCYKYARLESCGVEHTFSQYKSFSHDNRHRFMIHRLCQSAGS
jgi:hypothetical protein